MICSTGADNKFTNPLSWVCQAVGILGSKTFINVVVTVENYFDIMVIKKCVDLLHIVIGAPAG